MELSSEPEFEIFSGAVKQVHETDPIHKLDKDREGYGSVYFEACNNGPVTIRPIENGNGFYVGPSTCTEPYCRHVSRMAFKMEFNYKEMTVLIKYLGPKET